MACGAGREDASGCDLPTADVTATRVGGDREITRIMTRGAERPAVAELFFASFDFVLPLPIPRKQEETEGKQKQTKFERCHFGPAAADERSTGEPALVGGCRKLTTGRYVRIHSQRAAAARQGVCLRGKGR